MSEISNYVDNNFFIIDSKDLDNVDSKLFGYSMYNGEIYFNENIRDDIKLNGEGSYVRILKKKNNIEISQDFMACWGIYVYQYGNTFCISNSFLKLVDYLKTRYPISLNEDVALSFISAELCTIAYKQTMINEITAMPRNYILNIDIPSKTLNFSKIDYQDETVFLDTEEGIKILDQWFDKWVSIIRQLTNTGNFIQFDLTGGFDSRLVFSLLLNSNIDLNNIYIYSINSPIHEEDFEIASLLAEKYNFKINKVTRKKDLVNINNVEDSINMAYYVKLGFHHQFHFPKTISKEPSFVFGGLGGGPLRNFWNISPEKHINIYKRRAFRVSKELAEPTEKVLRDAIEKIQEEYGIENSSSTKLTQLLYKEIRNGNHFGKNAVAYYLTNQIRMSPLMDLDLYKFKKKKNFEDLLYVLIFVRYCPELLNVKFDGGKEFDKKIVEYAEEINKKYPLKKKSFNYIKYAATDYSSTNIRNNLDPDKYIENIFLSNSFRGIFQQYFSSKLYQKILKEVESKKFQYLSRVNVSMAVLTIIRAVKINQELLSKNPISWFMNYEVSNSPFDNVVENDIINSLKKFDTARLDIKNFGDENNSIEILEISDKTSNVMTPNWYANKTGIGHVIESNANRLKIKFQCIKDGTLKISLKAKHLRSKKTNKDLPIYINYTKFQINNENIISKNKTVHATKPFTYERKVNNNEIVSVEINWLPITEETGV